MRDEAVVYDLPPAKEERPAANAARRATLYMVCSGLFGAIALSALFFGFFMRGSVGTLLAGGEPILRGSYLGVIVEVFRGSIPLPSADGASLLSVLPVFLYFAIYALAAVTLLSPVLSVLSFLRPRAAHFLCVLNGFLVLFLHGTLCVSGVLLGALRGELFSWRQLDLPSFTAATLAFCVFAAMAIASRGLRGAASSLLLLFSATCVCAFIFPGTPLLHDLNLLAVGGDFWKRLFLGLLCIVMIANLILSVLRLEGRKGRNTDILRFSVQFAVALALAAVYMAETGAEEFFTDQLFASLFLLLSPLASLLFAAFVRTFSDGKKPREPAQASET